MGRLLLPSFAVLMAQPVFLVLRRQFKFVLFLFKYLIFNGLLVLDPVLGGRKDDSFPQSDGRVSGSWYFRRRNTRILGLGFRCTPDPFPRFGVVPRPRLVPNRTRSIAHGKCPHRRGIVPELGRWFRVRDRLLANGLNWIPTTKPNSSR